jgi:hypothetical protein
VTKPLLLLLSLYGLGDDDFRVRQASERYLDGSYGAVVLNRLAPYLTDDLETGFRLRRLEGRYYAAWDARLARNDWREYPSLALLSPWCEPAFSSVDLSDFLFWVASDQEYPFGPLLRHYLVKASEAANASDAGVPGRPRGYGAFFNGATLELLKDLRSGGAPAWAGEALLRYLRWRSTIMERRHGVRDKTYSRRAS